MQRFGSKVTLLWYLVLITIMVAKYTYLSTKKKKNVDQIGGNMSEIEITTFSIPSFLMMLYVFPQTNQKLLIFLKGIKPNCFMFIWTILKQ